MASYIGIDIGGTKIAGAVVTDSASVSMKQSLSTPVKEGGKAILAAAVGLAGQLLKAAAQSGVTINGIGIGAGGQIDAEQGYVYSATEVLPGWKGTRLTEAFQTAYNLPCRADNDVNVLALGESRFGAARHLATVGRETTVVFLALGTGVGGALVKGGRVHHGAHWSGGEFGHILLSMADDARCDTGGARGTLEAYCSGPGLVATYRELAADTPQAFSGEDVVAAAAAEKGGPENNGPASEAIALTGRYLGFGLTTLANALDPDLIIIGGGLSSLGEALLVPAREVLRERAMPGPSTCPVVIAGLEGEAAIVGAACLVMPSA
jgi:glucokinase